MAVTVEGPSGIGRSTAVARSLAELQTSRGAAASALDPGDIGYIEMLADHRELRDRDHRRLSRPGQRHARRDRRPAQAARSAGSELKRSKLIIVGINRAWRIPSEDHAPDLANRLDTIRFEVEPEHKILELINRRRQGPERRPRGQGEDRRRRTRKLLPRPTPRLMALVHGGSGRPRHPGTDLTVLRTPYNTVKRNVMERQDRRFGKAVKPGSFAVLVSAPGGRANYLHILSWLKDSETWAVSLTEELAHHPNEKASVEPGGSEGLARQADGDR